MKIMQECKYEIEKSGPGYVDMKDRQEKRRIIIRRVRFLRLSLLFQSLSVNPPKMYELFLMSVKEGPFWEHFSKNTRVLHPSARAL